MMQQALQDYLKRVKTNFPTFKRFGEGDEEFVKDERDYKIEIIELFRSEVLNDLNPLPEGEVAQAEIGRKIMGLFTRKLSTGSAQNLVGWRYYDFVLNSNSAKDAQFARLTSGLLYGSGALAQRIDQFIQGLSLLADKGSSGWAGMSRSVTSFLLMMSDPQAHVIIKTNEFKRAFKAFLGKTLPNRVLTGSDYLEIQKFLQDLLKEMNSAGLNPRDLIDVQSFIWVGDLEYDNAKPTGEDMSVKNELMATTKVAASQQPRNQILYGAAGTGKTYRTIDEAIRIIAPQFLADCKSKEKENKAESRKALKDRFDQLVKAERIRFVTFHQSFSYEDFVEGIRVKTVDGKAEYIVEPGVFKEACEAARGKVISNIDQPINLIGKRFWKMSLGDARAEPEVYDYCIENKVLLLGWGNDLDYAGCQTVNQIKDKMKQHGLSEYLVKYPSSADFVDRFKNKMKVGDLVVISEGNLRFRAIGEVTSDYVCVEGEDEVVRYVQQRSVKWLKVFPSSLPVERLFKKILSQVTIYNLSTGTIDLEKLAQLLQPESVLETAQISEHVLIIDEINRGNISRIFGELITLIEDGKREGQDEALEVILPYSKREFSVPENLYIIGTMNSSDRSLTGLDIALRRRFTFVEMQPDPMVLEGIKVEDVDIKSLLSTINQRIEILLDRDHCIGHAYFIELNDPEKQTVEKLGHIFKNKILPLLQEYFYDDWEKIDWVLNCNGMIEQSYQEAGALEKLFPKSAHGKLQNHCWRINKTMFDDIDNYQAIIGLSS